MQQDRDGPIWCICARVRGKAGGCKYLLNCGCDRAISYSENILQDIAAKA